MVKTALAVGCAQSNILPPPNHVMKAHGKKPNRSPLGAPQRQGWTLHRCDSFDEMRVQAIRRWQRASATARTDAAWELVVAAWKMKRWNPDELRLQRTVTVLRKA